MSENEGPWTQHHAEATAAAHGLCARGAWDALVDWASASTPAIPARAVRLACAAVQFVVAGGPASTLGRLLDAGASPDTADRELEGRALLDRCAADGRLEAVRLLLARGAAVEGAPWSDEFGRARPPLHAALEGGHVEVARALLDAGADPNSTDWADLPALQQAIWADPPGLPALLELLLDRRANPNACPGGQFVEEPGPALWTLLTAQLAHRGRHVAALPALVELLLDRGADPDGASPADGSTPLHVVARSGRDEQAGLVDLLRARGADLHRLDADGSAPIDLAATDAVAARLE